MRFSVISVISAITVIFQRVSDDASVRASVIITAISVTAISVSVVVMTLVVRIAR
jgi:hypothetical protein